MIRRPPRSTHCISSAASDVYKRQELQLQKGYVELSNEDLEKLEQRKKEKQRILERLNDLDRFQKYHQDKLQEELTKLEIQKQRKSIPLNIHYPAQPLNPNLWEYGGNQVYNSSASLIQNHLSNRYGVQAKQGLLNMKLDSLEIHKKRIQEYEFKVQNLEKKLLFKNN
eukprot:TRINITY_DN13051_c0_g1_i4.p1 TRINITY_DN13051_c0_g1~~TRINITY_DN13051_c0_g1_i4.p1  ORF type:complete len:168 (+),score=47.30 TRINITY_DN13051_c0_g1_i4:94-597(+)